MKQLKTLTALLLAVAFAAAPMASFAADNKAPQAKEKAKAKPYPLKKCLVSDEELGGMGDPYVFVHENQEIKLCCKSCQKDFNKAPAKYMKKLKEEAEKAEKQKAKK